MAAPAPDLKASRSVCFAVDLAGAAGFLASMLLAIPFPDISPEIFTIRLGDFAFSLRWYALAYIVGILIGWRLATAAAVRPALWPEDRSPFTAKDVEELMTTIILGIIIGGRVGYCLFYQPAYYLQNPLEIAMVWQGGMSFHGGMLGVTLGGLFFAWRKGIALLSMLDLMSIGTPPGLLTGRLANFINAELWGRPTDAPWGVIFPGQAAQDCAGVVGLCARHPSQLYEAALEGVLLLALIVVLAFRRGWLKRPGQICGIFLIGYAVSRMLVELVRQADPQFITPGNPMGYVVQIGSAGLSMGQLLSLPMLAVGVALILNARMRR